MASQGAVRIGLARPETDDEIRSDIIRNAKEYGIQLEPNQVTVQRTGPADAPALYLAADYKVPVKLPGYSFALHFAPGAQGKPLEPIRQGR